MTGTRTLVVMAALVVCAYVAPVGVQAAARSFAWYGELVSVDQAARTLTIKADIREAPARSLRNYKPGDRLISIWDVQGATGGDGMTVLAVATPEQMHVIDDGYITRVEFVTADPDARTITFKVTVPDVVLQTVASMQPGRWIRVTAPMEQPGPLTMLTSATATDRPSPRPRAVPSAEPAAADDKPRVAAAAPVKANGGISGPWAIRFKDQNSVSHYTECQLAQDGPAIGGACKGPDVEVRGSASGTQIELRIPSGGAELVHTGTLDGSGTRITGTLLLSGVELRFEATKN